MARTSRRHILPLTGASALVTALALTAGPVAAQSASAQPSAGGLALSMPADSTPPPPSPDESGNSTPPGPTSSNPTPTTPSTKTSSDGTSDTGTSSDSTGNGSASAAVQQQKSDVDDVAADLDDKDVPEDLAPSVDQLSAVLQAVNEDEQTPPQQRDGTLTSARQVADTLDVIADPGTPPAVRSQLTGLVEELTAALHQANDPGTPPDNGRLLTLVAARSAPFMALVGDQAAPPEVVGNLTRTLHDLYAYAARGGDWATIQTTSAAVQLASDSDTSDDERKGLAEIAKEASSSPGRKHRLEKKMKDVLTARGLPNEPLGKAAQACANRVFEAVPDTTLAEDLRDLVPDAWDSTGVQDFWKSEASGDDSLDVYAQLQDNSRDDAPLATEDLLPQLAGRVPADDVFGLGAPALDCLKAALQLDKKAGVESGNWVNAAQQI